MLLVTATGCVGSVPVSPSDRVEVKLRILDAARRSLRTLPWCDLRVYPSGRVRSYGELAGEADHLRESDPGTYAAIVDHEGIDPASRTYDDLALIESDALEVGQVVLTRAGGGYRFSFPRRYDQRATLTGVVSPAGGVRFLRIRPQPVCPVCLAAGTHIATPNGPVAVTDLRVGTVVWSVDAGGHRITVPVLRVARTPAPPGHRVVRLELATGRTVLASPGHPTPDGRLIGELQRGDVLNGVRVLSTQRWLYSSGFTYDLLPGGPTGTYFANGVLLGSTLSEPMGTRRASKAA